MKSQKPRKKSTFFCAIKNPTLNGIYIITKEPYDPVVFRVPLPLPFVQIWVLIAGVFLCPLISLNTSIYDSSIPSWILSLLRTNTPLSTGLAENTLTLSWNLKMGFFCSHPFFYSNFFFKSDIFWVFFKVWFLVDVL